MDFLKKNKIVVGIVVLVLVVGGGLLMMMGGSKAPQSTDQTDQTSDVKQINPDDIGLSLELTSSKQAVIMRVTKLDGIKSLEYELSYDAEEEFEGETSVVPKGAGSSEPIEVEGESEIEREILLGTCSARVCRYDVIKSDIKALVRVNFENGEVGASETTIPYEEEE
jgi:hypothetical protein